jgi:lipopolysaccharide assembly outer membrane protein LptD (OstA)
MKNSKNIFLFALVFLTASWCSAQCTVPSTPKNTFVLVQSHKIIAKNNNIQKLSGSVIFQINDYQLKADSAIVFTDSRKFKAFGNVVLTKDGIAHQNGQKAVYREDLHIINFDDSNIFDVEVKNLSEKSTSAVYTAKK